MCGLTFGNLKVERQVDKDGRGELMWLCSCACGSGKVKVVRGSALRSGGTQGCGCLNPVRLRPYEALYRRFVREAKNARSREIDVDISFEQFLEFTEVTKCFYCDAKISWPKFQTNGIGYHLDRKDSNEGYSVSNCVVCCTRCNRGKSNLFTCDEWTRMTAVLRK